MTKKDKTKTTSPPSHMATFRVPEEEYKAFRIQMIREGNTVQEFVLNAIRLYMSKK